MARSLGLGAADAATVLGWYERIVGAVAGVSAGRPVTATGAPPSPTSTRTATAWRPATPRSSLLAAAPTPAGWTTRGVVSNAAVILFGGIETTEGMIANAHLAPAGVAGRSSPRCGPIRRCCANAVEESLRLEPAAAVVDRYATRDVELGRGARSARRPGHGLAGGRQPRPGLVRRPRPLRRAARERPPPRAFAHGPHVCLGMHLARIEAQVALRRVLALPGLRLDPERPSAPRGLVFRKPPAVHVLWTAA